MISSTPGPLPTWNSSGRIEVIMRAMSRYTAAGLNYHQQVAERWQHVPKTANSLSCYNSKYLPCYNSNSLWFWLALLRTLSALVLQLSVPIWWLLQLMGVSPPGGLSVVILLSCFQACHLSRPRLDISNNIKLWPTNLQQIHQSWTKAGIAEVWWGPIFYC